MESGTCQEAVLKHCTMDLTLHNTLLFSVYPPPFPFRAVYQQLMTAVIFNPHDTEEASGGEVVDHVSYDWCVVMLTFFVHV